MKHFQVSIEYHTGKVLATVVTLIIRMGKKNTKNIIRAVLLLNVQ